MLIREASSARPEPYGSDSGSVFSPVCWEAPSASSASWLCLADAGGFFFWSTALGLSRLPSVLFRFLVSFFVGRLTDGTLVVVVVTTDMSSNEIESAVDRLSLEARLGATGGMSEERLCAAFSLAASVIVVPFLAVSSTLGRGVSGEWLSVATTGLTGANLGSGLALGVGSLGVDFFETISTSAGFKLRGEAEREEKEKKRTAKKNLLGRQCRHPVSS